MELLSTGSNLLLIFAGFCLLIAIHELGHFLAARWAGIRVEGFAIGMGPQVLSYRRGIGAAIGSTDRQTIARFGCTASEMSDAVLARNGLGETEYSLRIFPLGGFVRMLGQEDANPAAVSDDPRSYQRAPVWKRMVVVSAGVVANLILAIALFLVAFMVGVRFPAPIAGSVPANSPAAGVTASNAAAAGLSPETAKGIRPGDRVVAIDGEPVLNYLDVLIGGGLARPGVPVEVEVERAGVATPLLFSIVPERDRASGLLTLGIGAAFSTTITTERDSRTEVGRILGETGLAAHGVEPGMRLAAIGDVPVRTAQQVARIVNASAGGELVTHWSAGSDPEAAPTISAPLSVDPEFELFRVASGEPAGSDGEFVIERGLCGLLPLMRVEFVDPSSPNVGILQINDVLLKLGRIDAPTFVKLRSDLAARKGSTVDVVVERDGREVPLTCKVDRRGRLGIALGVATGTRQIAGVAASEFQPAKQAGEAPTALPTPAAGLDLFPRSEIVRVGETPVANWREIRAAIKRATDNDAARADGAEVAIDVRSPLRDSEPERHVLRLTADDVARVQSLGWSTELLSTFDPEYVTLKASGPIEAISMGLAQTKRMALQVYLTLDRVARRSVSIEQLNGPVGILHAGVKVADQGLMYLVFFLAAISVNLAVMNFLPLPIVDGGLFLFLVYEKIRGRPPSIAFQNAATAVGLMLIGSIFLITFFNDLRRLLG
ncbi:MAG: site-2 protease family protein [Phycisphaerales bacterium]